MTKESAQHPSRPEFYNSAPVAVILTVILLLFFFIGFLFIYFCKCIMHNLIYRGHIRHSDSGTPASPAGSTGATGLDPSIIKSFPTFPYSNVKDFRREKYGLECAICLCEFEDDNFLRLLTSCCHVFHQECIDLWLDSHKTCPVCRMRLDTSPEKSPISIANRLNPMQYINENESLEGTFSINVRDDNEDERGGSGKRDIAGGPSTAGRVEGHDEVEKFPRSHSTGHSIARTKEEEEDRFTLRLPEHVKAKLMRWHNWPRSCTTFGDYQSKTSTGNGGFGEVSGLPGGGGDINKV
ncbi:unnamed protein product [Ilex paraguariensis]|uniref:RING-type E3 ubiquitin transferase n=1 Tax=Ilex paraguariensis TaxID=185542 RepID=A0ABC8TTJ9_9AQUA